MSAHAMHLLICRCISQCHGLAFLGRLFCFYGDTHDTALLGGNFVRQSRASVWGSLLVPLLACLNMIIHYLRGFGMF